MKQSPVKFSCVLALAASLFLAACGGGGGGGTSGTSSPGGGTPAGPAFTGFDFTLAAGTFWEYRWDYYFSQWGSGSTTDAGRFWVVLGQPLQIQGTPAYEVQIYGKSRNTGRTFTPRWTYLAMADGQMMGSTDGTTLVTVFDAQKGYWPGGGFFTSLGSSLVVAKNGSISNSYITGTAVVVERSASQSECEYFPGIGNICGDSSYDYKEKEFYRGGIGPIAYYYYNSYTDCGGGFCSGATWIHNAGMTASSLNGNSLPFIYEAEPDNSPAGAQRITLPAVIIGDCQVGDANYHLSTTALNPPDIYVEDWYTFTLASQRTVKISLDFEASPTADLDLFLFDNSSTPVLAGFSGKDNPTLKDQNETITKLLSAGTYRIGVDAYSTSAGRVKYTLQVE